VTRLWLILPFILACAASCLAEAVSPRSPRRAGELSGRVASVAGGERLRQLPPADEAPDLSGTRQAAWRSRSGRSAQRCLFHIAAVGALGQDQHRMSPSVCESRRVGSDHLLLCKLLE
jgi:hypothetical protein